MNSAKIELQILKDIFHSPQDSFDLYLNQKLLNKNHLFFIHFKLASFSIFFKLFYNLIIIHILTKYIQIEIPKWHDGLLTGLGIYLGVLFIVYHLDILLLTLRAGENKIEEIENRDIFLISFLPFSSSSLFWFLPKPFNFIFIFISLIYSFQLSYLALRRILYFSFIQILVFLVYIFILILLLSGILLGIIKWLR
jgi:hypothetical protein